MFVVFPCERGEQEGAMEPSRENLLEEGSLEGWSSSVELLTPRQLDVFFLLGKGLSTKQIAIRLTVTEHTVKAHTARILHVLGLESRLQAGLVAYVYATSVTRRGAGHPNTSRGDL
ncbi:helix-turn-helix transcriptional regulator [Sphaerisporangium sp. NPDC051011]